MEQYEFGIQEPITLFVFSDIPKVISHLNIITSISSVSVKLYFVFIY